MSKLLFFGASVSQLPAIRHARAAGHVVVACSNGRVAAPTEAFAERSLRSALGARQSRGRSLSLQRSCTGCIADRRPARRPHALRPAGGDDSLARSCPPGGGAGRDRSGRKPIAAALPGWLVDRPRIGISVRLPTASRRSGRVARQGIHKRRRRHGREALASTTRP